MPPEMRADSNPSTVRYWVLLLTFVTAMIMYIDRTVMGTVTPYMRHLAALQPDPVPVTVQLETANA